MISEPGQHMDALRTGKGFVSEVSAPWPAPWDGMTGMRLYLPIWVAFAPCAYEPDTQI